MQTVVRFVTSRRLTRNQTTAAAEDEVYDKSIRVLHWLMAGKCSTNIDLTVIRWHHALRRPCVGSPKRKGQRKERAADVLA